MDPDPTPDPTPSFIDIKDAKKIFKIFFLARRHIIFSLKNLFFAKILCSNFILQALFQSAQHIYEKGKIRIQTSY